jgi:hypothetical protein
MTAGRRQEVRLEIRIEAAPETVFALLTEPAQMQIWLAEAVDANARPGGVFRISGPTDHRARITERLNEIAKRQAVPTENPKPLTSSCESVDTQPDGRALRVHLVCYSRAIPVAGGVASRNPRSSSPAQYSAP